MPVTLIVARAAHGVIGRNNTLPWRLPEDLRHFKAATMGHALVMGRKTFESIGRPLPGRRTIVVSRSPHWQADGCERAASLDEALALARRGALATNGTSDTADPEVFVAGGAMLYREALARADRILMTEIDLEVEGDVYFPEIDPRQWDEVRRDARTSANGTRFAIVDLRRHPGEGSSAR
jgi:dihydrofolate reductase